MTHLFTVATEATAHSVDRMSGVRRHIGAGRIDTVRAGNHTITLTDNIERTTDSRSNTLSRFSS